MGSRTSNPDKIQNHHTAETKRKIGTVERYATYISIAVAIMSVTALVGTIVFGDMEKAIAWLMVFAAGILVFALIGRFILWFVLGRCRRPCAM
jgi:hypothetical protein